MLHMLRQREALLSQYAQKGPEHKREAQSGLYRSANARKALTGQYHGLLDPAILAAKASLEKGVRAPLDADPARETEYGHPWDKIADTLKKFAESERRDYLLER